jgi:hypothetical protein
LQPFKDVQRLSPVFQARGAWSLDQPIIPMTTLPPRKGNSISCHQLRVAGFIQLELNCMVLCRGNPIIYLLKYDPTLQK